VEAMARQKAENAALAERVQQLEARLASSEVRAAPQPPRPEVKVPDKPQVIDGWTLQGFNRGTAWLKGPAGLIEVREGDDIPGIGKVKAIQKYLKDYVVVTNIGVIMREMRN